MSRRHVTARSICAPPNRICLRRHVLRPAVSASTERPDRAESRPPRAAGERPRDGTCRTCADKTATRRKQIRAAINFNDRFLTANGGFGVGRAPGGLGCSMGDVDYDVAEVGAQRVCQDVSGSSPGSQWDTEIIPQRTRTVDCSLGAD